MLILLLVVVPAHAFQCIFDTDCRLDSALGIHDQFCVNNRCTSLKPSGSPCKSPTECSAFSYYGPLACTASCGTKRECGVTHLERTVYCCRSIPLKGKCNPARPRSLSGCAKGSACLVENGIPRCAEMPEQSWLIGVLLCLCGNLLINLGVNFQKKSYTARTVELFGIRVNSMCLGIVLYTTGKLSAFSAYIFCNQSLLAGLSASGLIANSVFAPIVNNEIFTWNDATAILLVIIGTAVIFGNTSRVHTSYTTCELLIMLGQTRNILWLLFIVTCIGTLFFTVKFVEINSPWNLANDRFQFLRTDRVTFDENGIVLKYLMVLIYVFLSSFIATFTTLSIKILGQIMGRYLNEQGPVLSFTTLFFTVLLILCTFLQIYWLNRALKHFDVLIALPVFHITWTILSIVTAGVYFQDFVAYSSAQLRRFVLGVLVVFSGSIFLGLKMRNANVLVSQRVSGTEHKMS